jgi:hypothetical protein
VVQAAKQEAEREAVESKIQEHLKVLQYKNIFNCVLLHYFCVLTTNYNW